MRLRWPYRGKTYVIVGRTVYSLWYGDPMQPQSNLVVVETKWRGMDGEYQCISYMGMLHHIRKQTGKQNTDIYGIATDSFKWTLRVKHRVDIQHTLSWIDGQGPEIISHLHKIMYHAALLSPAASQAPSRQPTR